MWDETIGLEIENKELKTRLEFALLENKRLEKEKESAELNKAHIIHDFALFQRSIRGVADIWQKHMDKKIEEKDQEIKVLRDKITAFEALVEELSE